MCAHNTYPSNGKLLCFHLQISLSKYYSEQRSCLLYTSDAADE